MSRIAISIAAAASFALGALLAPAPAAAQDEAADAGVAADAAEVADAGPSPSPPPPTEPDLGEDFVPEVAAALPYDDAQPPAPAPLPDGKPFAKGDMEPGLGLGFAGYGDLYYMIIGGSFAYYVVNHLAPGLEVTYGTDFGSADIPDSVTLLPFLKFVIIRSSKFAPYLVAGAGREFEFAGYNAVGSWLVAFGAGAHIGLGEHVSIRLQVTFEHHWYDDPRIRGWRDGGLYEDEYGNEYGCPFEGGCDWDGWVHPYDEDGNLVEDSLCDPDSVSGGSYTACAGAVADRKDLDREWIYPIISVGMSFSF